MISNIFFSFFNTCKKITKLKNRASRREYIYYTIVLIAFNILLYPIHSIFLQQIPLVILYFFLLVQTIFVLITLSLNIRRLHDINISILWYIFYIIVTSLIYFYFVGKDDGISLRAKMFAYSSFIFMKLFFIFFKGTEGLNKYGPPPEY